MLVHTSAGGDTELKEYIYRDRKTGEILVSLEKVEDPELELIAEVETSYGGRGKPGTAHT